LQGATDKAQFKGFRFEAYWLGILGFQEVVKQACTKLLQATDTIRRLHIKLLKTTKALKIWEKFCIGNIKNQLAIAKEDIWLIDQAQERRTLTQVEMNFKARLNDVYLGLLAVEKIRARQRARLTNIRYGDANSKLFYLRANGRK
jgi:hypothetical protein